MAQRLHAPRGCAGAQPALISQQKAAGAGGRRGPRAQAGAGWQSRTRPPARAHGRASAKGAQARRCRLAMAARPASRPCLAVGGAELGVPPHAATPTLRRGLGTGEEEEEEDKEGMVEAQQRMRLPPGHPKESGRKGGAGSITPSTTVLSPCCDPGMLCPVHSKTSPAPQVATAEGHRLIPALLPLVLGAGACRSREQPCPTQRGLAEQDVGREGLNRPPQPHVAKGNTKCQSHQPQYVRAPAERSSAKAALVQAVPAPLPRALPAPSAASCPRGQRAGKGLGRAPGPDGSQAGGIMLCRAHR